MRVRMLKTAPISPDGFTVFQAHEGSEQDLSASPRAEELAQLLVREGLAVDAAAPLVPPTHPSQPKAAEVVRLPPLDEYVAAGYEASTYEGFIASRTAEAEARGLTVSVVPAPVAAAASAPEPKPTGKRKGR